MRKEITVPIELEDRTVNFQLIQLPAEFGYRLKTHILKKLGIGVLGQINWDDPMGSDARHILSSFLDKLDPEEDTNIIFKSLKLSIIGPKVFVENIDESLADCYDAIDLLFWEILKLNYQTTIKRLQKKIPKNLKTVMHDISGSPEPEDSSQQSSKEGSKKQRKTGS